MTDLGTVLTQVSEVLTNQAGVIGTNTDFYAGRVDDPDSFDANGGKTGPLGYYPLVLPGGRTVFIPSLSRLLGLAPWAVEQLSVIVQGLNANPDFAAALTGILDAKAEKQTLVAVQQKTSPFDLDVFLRASGYLWALVDPARRRALSVREDSAVGIGSIEDVELLLLPLLAGRVPLAGSDMFDRAYLDGRDRRRRLVLWGDSTLQQYLASVSSAALFAAAYPGIIVDNRGVASQKSYNVSARQGSTPVFFTAATGANLIPSSGSVVMTPVVSPSMFGGTPYDQDQEIEWCGVRGTMHVPGTDHPSDPTLFTRKFAGPQRHVPPGGAAVVVADSGLLRDANTIIGVGRNNPVLTEVMRDLKLMTDFLGHDRFGIETILTKVDEPSGTSGYSAVMEINAAINAEYSGHVIDTRAALVAAYDPSKPADVTAHAGDTIPPSLMGDQLLHVNNAGAATVFGAENGFATARGWFN